MLRGPDPLNDPFFANPDGTRNRKKTYCDWTMQIPQTMYTPMHWLAYHNDWMSVKYLLALCLDKSDDVHELRMVRLIMRENADNMTPLDIAGRNGSIRSAIVLINYFKEVFGVLAARFNGGENAEGDPGNFIYDASGKRKDYM